MSLQATQDGKLQFLWACLQSGLINVSTCASNVLLDAQNGKFHSLLLLLKRVFLSGEHFDVFPTILPALITTTQPLNLVLQPVLLDWLLSEWSWSAAELQAEKRILNYSKCTENTMSQPSNDKTFYGRKTPTSQLESWSLTNLMILLVRVPISKTTNKRVSWVSNSIATVRNIVLETHFPRHRPKLISNLKTKVKLINQRTRA